MPKNVNIGATGSGGNTAHPENAPINKINAQPSNDGMNDYATQLNERAKHFRPVLGTYPRKYRMETEEGKHMSKDEIKHVDNKTKLNKCYIAKSKLYLFMFFAFLCF